MTILTTLTLEVPADRRDDVVAFYAAARVLQESGATSTRLCTSTGDLGTVLVIAEWPDEHAYLSWQASPRREEFSQGILDAAAGRVTATSESFQVVIET